MIVNDHIIPRYLFKNKKVHRIIWADRRFTVYRYIIETHKYNRLDKVILERAFHPNAKYISKEPFIDVSCIYQRPKNVYLCIPDIFKRRKFGNEVTKDMIRNLISNWNLDDCYYVPHTHLFGCDPKL